MKDQNYSAETKKSFSLIPITYIETRVKILTTIAFMVGVEMVAIKTKWNNGKLVPGKLKHVHM